jgi:hypothetical protein
MILLTLPGNLLWATVVTVSNPNADTFVLNPGSGATSSNASANYNYGSSGSLSVASAAASQKKGEFDTLLKFNCGSLAGQTVTDLKLTASLLNGNSSAGGIFNYPGSAGNFDIYWISSNWVEGTGEPMSQISNGITYNGLQSMLAEDPAVYLDTFYYGDYNLDGVNDSGVHSFILNLSNGHYDELLEAISAGQNITLMLTPSDGSNVAFNLTGRNNATLTFTSIPEPSTLALLLSGVMLSLKFRRNRQTF